MFTVKLVRSAKTLVVLESQRGQETLDYLRNQTRDSSAQQMLKMLDSGKYELHANRFEESGTVTTPDTARHIIVRGVGGEAGSIDSLGRAGWIEFMWLEAKENEG